MAKAVLVLFIGFFVTILFVQSDCFAIQAFVNTITHPIHAIVHHNRDHNSNSEDSNKNGNGEIEMDNKEHGTLDSFGRDIIRATGKKIREFQTQIKNTFSKVTKGLDCNTTLSEGKKDTFKSKINAIYPGTKWCGDGNISETFDDLGKFSKTDRCCREHDMCPDNMPADSNKHGLQNTGLFTRSHCDCDGKFYKCLKEASSIVADSIGYTYFTVLGPQCFKQDYPLVDCIKMRKGKCEEYEKDTRGEKSYQWFDSAVF